MTTTTRTTRKAPWAAALTALLAVLGLVFGALVIAGPAIADPDPDKTPPGQSEAFAPPVQQGDNGGGNDKPDDYLPPGQNPDWTPPGQVDGDGPGSPGYKVWICHADTNHGNGQDNLGNGEFKLGYNLIEVSWSAWTNSHNRLHPNDVLADVTTGSPVCPQPATKYFCPAPSETVELSAPYDAAKDYAKCFPTTEKQDGQLCDLTAVPPSMVQFDDITSQAYKDAIANTAKYAQTCPVTTEQTAAIDAALGTVAPEPVTAVAVEAATVTEEPEAVAVPAPATVALPAAVPAGDGSTVPRVPVALLALLALATAAAVTSGLRMATNR